MVQHSQKKATSAPFLFPRAHSTVVPDPSRFFSPSLLSSPLPTNTFFQNFTLRNGDQPEYIHPYLIKYSQSSLSVCYPSLIKTSSSIYQKFVPDLTITASNKISNQNHFISSFSDLSVTLDIPSSNMRFYLVRGSPYLTCSVPVKTPISISTAHAIQSFSSNSALTKHTVKLSNNQFWFIYSSLPIHLKNNGKVLTSGDFSGIIWIAVSPDFYTSGYEAILDQFQSTYAVSGDADFTKPFCLEYKWKKEGCGELLMLAHPLHIKLLSRDDCGITILHDFKYRSIDGDLVGVVGENWVLKPEPIPVTWHSIKGVQEDSIPEILTSLCKDVEGLNLSAAIKENSPCFYGIMIARAARLALIAEEVRHLVVIPSVIKFLKDKIQPWLEGTLNGNGFVYEDVWGGITTIQGSRNSNAEYGFGIYNNHHYYMGYFLYAIAVVVKNDPEWGKKYRPQAYSLMANFMNLDRGSKAKYPRLRCFDLFKLHSWAAGLAEFADGRHHENTGEGVNAFYSAALMGLAYNDRHLVAVGSTLAAMEINAAETWWHVKDGDYKYGKDFSRKNRVVGVLWSNMRDSRLWFAPSESKECRLGIQLLPLVPITEILFSDIAFVKDLVSWTLPALKRGDVKENWKGYVYALEGIYDKETALKKIRNLRSHQLTNLLWWIHSRGEDREDNDEVKDECEECEGSENLCVFCSESLCWLCQYSD